MESRGLIELMVLDTDTATDAFYGKPKVRERLLALPCEAIAITVITKIEMLSGRFQQLHTANTPEEFVRAQQALDRTEDFLAGFRILPMDEPAAHEFMKLLKLGLRRLGRPDLLIGSIVKARRAILITRNIKDFRRIPNLRLEDWSK